MSEEELETTEGEGVYLLAQHLELVGWSQVNDKETEKDLSCLLSFGYCLINFVEYGLCFL